MARVLVATQSWGVLWEKASTRALSVPLPGVLAAIDTTVYAAASGGTVVAAPSFVTNADGELPGYVEPGSYTLTVGLESFAVEAASGTPASAVTSVAGRTGAVVLTKTDVGLANVDNTADAAKPVSSAVAAEFVADRVRLDSVESSNLLQLAYDPDGLLVGVFTRDANDAVLSAPAEWPDGATGEFTATIVSSAFPGAVDAYTITHDLDGDVTTYTQPQMTRNASGAVTNRPAITVS